MVQRIKYSFMYFFLLVVLFTHFIPDTKSHAVIQLNNKSYFIKITQSVVLHHLRRSRTQLFSTELLASVVHC